MNMGHQNNIDITKARIIRPGDGAPCIVKDTGTVRVLENHGPVQ